MEHKRPAILDDTDYDKVDTPAARLAAKILVYGIFGLIGAVGCGLLAAFWYFLALGLMGRAAGRGLLDYALHDTPGAMLRRFVIGGAVGLAVALAFTWRLARRATRP